MARRTVVLALGCLLLAACIGRSPFTRSPAQIAMKRPCRYMGTLHKESRSILERLRADGTVTREEWACMARSLGQLDDEYSERCKSRAVSFDEISADQKARYRVCLVADRAFLAECAALDHEATELPDSCG